jgi:demethoxyubiquinone hydroxylase (CLK1/Coq7/Cat5 family)
MPSSGMLRRVALVRADVSEELSASIIRVTRIGELGKLAVTSNRSMLRRNTTLRSYKRFVTLFWDSELDYETLCSEKHQHLATEHHEMKANCIRC